MWAPESWFSGKMEGEVIIFDFDRTIIDDDSDRWVIVQMGLTHLFNQLRLTLPWNSLMVSIYLSSVYLIKIQSFSFVLRFCDFKM